MTKMTYVQAIDVAIVSVSDEAVIEKLEALKASLMKKSTAERKPTKTQVENASLKEEILSLMEEDKSYRVSELAKAMSTEVSSQKMSALLKQLKDDGKIVKEEVKRIAYFKLA